MCRANGADGEGRRCPCDSSAARLNRRSNAQMKAEHSGNLSTLTPSHTLPSLAEPEAKEVTVKEVKQDINHLNTLLETPGASDSDIDTTVMKIGEGVATLAERDHDAPTDDDFANLISPGQKRAQELNANTRKLAEDFAKLHAECRKSAGLSPVANVSTLFEKLEEFEGTGLSEEKMDEMKMMIATRSAMISEHGKLRDTLNPQDYAIAHAGVFQRRNEAMRAALESVGVEFADPETLIAGKKSQKGAVEAVKSGLRFYPQSWVEASNEAQAGNKPLILKVSKRRAHYREGKMQAETSVQQISFLTTKPHGWEPDPETREGQEWVKGELNNEGTWTNPVDGQSDRYAKPHENVWVRRSFDYNRSPEKPRGNGWEQVTYQDEKYDSSKNEWETREISSWRRPIRVRRTSSYSPIDELTVNDSKTFTSRTPGHRIGLHEMAHRFERTVPSIARAQRAFLNRRRGAGTDSQEELSVIYAGSKEKGYKDNFNSHYMGKVYTGKNYEVMSMGMESLFAGSQNGLTHNASSILPPDDDYRKFILGALTIRPMNK